MRVRRGDSDRDIARASLTGRNKLRRFRPLADQHGWLDPAKPLPDPDEICWVVGRVAESDAPGDSSVGPYRAQIEFWARQGIQASTIHQALVRNLQYDGSNSPVYRFVRSLILKKPKATVRLTFSYGEAAQVDFGALTFISRCKRSPGIRLISRWTGLRCPTEARSW